MAKASRKLTNYERIVSRQNLKVGDTVTGEYWAPGRTAKITGFFLDRSSDLYAHLDSGGYSLASRLRKVEVPNA